MNWIAFLIALAFCGLVAAVAAFATNYAALKRRFGWLAPAAIWCGAALVFSSYVGFVAWSVGT